MGTDELFSELSNWLLMGSPVLFGGILAISLGGNLYLLKKFKESIDVEKKYVQLLKDIEPLLTKIINEDKFTKDEINDAKTIKSIIKFSLENHVR